ncbi:hypothetical protein JKP88DRAFT_255717 [Tribonema minus]|uniref:Uncharacterized protein n=1 Tax=Tribonema minus TaxID=303371 RepID=A0A835YY05_9STRA|nr:hypothetical protein JKP88DRAFT_255717 [Tribonema minus]
MSLANLGAVHANTDANIVVESVGKLATDDAISTALAAVYQSKLDAVQESSSTHAMFGAMEVSNVVRDLTTPVPHVVPSVTSVVAQESPQQETPSQATVVVSEAIDDASPSPEPAVSEPILETLVVQPAVEQEVAVADNDAVSAAASATTEPAADTTAQSSVDAVSESSSALLTRVLEGLESGSMTAKEAMELLTPLTKMTAVRGDRAIQKANFTAEQLQDNQSIIDGTSVLGSIRRPNLAKQMQVGCSKQGEDLFKRLTELKAKTDANMDTHGKATLVSKQNSPTRVTLERHATRVKRTQPDRRAKRDRGTTFEVLATLSGSGQDFLDAVRSLALGTESEAKILAVVEPFLNVPNEQLGMTVEEVAAAHNSNIISGALNALQARVILTTLRYSSSITYRHLSSGGGRCGVSCQWRVGLLCSHDGGSREQPRHVRPASVCDWVRRLRNWTRVRGWR